MQRDVYQAIADPTRRAIIDLLAEQALPVNAVAGQFDISRPAVSKHIKILDECGLLVVRQHGRKRYCRADLRKLERVAEWADQYSRFWTGKLERLEKLIEEEISMEQSTTRKSNP